jgi:hypothetical protein
MKINVLLVEMEYIEYYKIIIANANQATMMMDQFFASSVTKAVKLVR